MRQNPHVRICGGPGSATTLVYPTVATRRASSVESARRTASIGFLDSTTMISVVAGRLIDHPPTLPRAGSVGQYPSSG